MKYLVDRSMDRMPIIRPVRAGESGGVNFSVAVRTLCEHLKQSMEEWVKGFQAIVEYEQKYGPIGDKTQ